MPKISTCLWFNGLAEEAANFYISIFENSRITGISRFRENEHGVEGSVMTVSFELEGKEFIALNGGPDFSFSPAISYYVHCKDQQELDWYWEKLSQGGEKVQCGWLTDKFGVSWQIVPEILGKMMQDPDPARVGRVTQAILKMIKLDIAELEKAYSSQAH